MMQYCFNFLFFLFFTIAKNVGAKNILVLHWKPEAQFPKRKVRNS